jgi:hypothetical protein
MAEFINSESTTTTTTSNKRKRDDFRINTQQLFLTYPKCPISPTICLELLNRLPIIISNKIEIYIIAQEKHQDGTEHLHAYLKLGKKCNVNNQRACDILFENVTYHPNIQGVRSSKSVTKYVVKEGNYITNLSDTAIAEAIASNTKVGEVYEKARKVAKIEGVSKAMEVLETVKTARDLTVHGDAIQRNLQKLVTCKLVVPYSIDTYKLNFVWDRTKTLILWGPTNTGKTSLAKALLPKALFVRHMDRVKEYINGTFEGIIFDDMGFKHLPREAQLHIVDTYDITDIHVRYGVATLPSGTPRIITTNLMPQELLLSTNGEIDPAIARRIEIVYIGDPLY